MAVPIQKFLILHYIGSPPAKQSVQNRVPKNISNTPFTADTKTSPQQLPRQAFTHGTYHHRQYNQRKT